MKFKNLLFKLAGSVASLALTVAVMTANSACWLWSYQPKTPEGLKKDDPSARS